MFQALIGPVAGLLDKFIEDKDQKNKLAHEIATMSEKHANKIAEAQIEVNKEESEISHLVDESLLGPSGEILPELLKYCKN